MECIYERDNIQVLVSQCCPLADRGMAVSSLDFVPSQAISRLEIGSMLLGSKGHSTGWFAKMGMERERTARESKEGT